MLRDNPNVTIEMASHTDRWGSEEYNIDLSGRRARSVIDYLISVGIQPDRLQSQGYGKSRPKTITKKLARLYPQFKEGDVLTPEFIESLPETDQEVADQINRRTEFQVLSIDYQMYCQSAFRRTMFFTEVKIERNPGAIRHGDKIWSIGSCFADEIGRRMADALFDIRVNPCGTLYNPFSIANALTRIASGTPYTKADIFQHNGLWHCMDFHSSFSRADATEAIAAINGAITALHAELSRLRLLMVTFGSAYFYSFV